MKNKTSKFLICFLIFVVILFFYNKCSSENKAPDKKILNNNESNSENKNNLIKNLRYDVNFENGTTYNISAKLSEIIYVNNDETVNMQQVTAIIINKDALPLMIKSDYAIFNNTTYNTTFNENVTIDYINNSIQSEKLFLDFENSVVIIKDNIIYEGMNGIGKTDNIKINLKTKDIQIFMNNTGEKVKITSK